MNSSDWIATQESFSSLSSIVVRHASQAPECLAVFCHGFGAPGDDLAGLAEWMLEECEKIDVVPLLVFPAAPIDLSDEDMPGGRAWWRLNMARLMQATMTNSFDEIRSEIPEGIDEARNQLVELIDGTRRQFDLATTPLLLGGFSQGAMLAMDTAVRGLEKPPEGMALYSGALICEHAWKRAVNRLAETDTFQSHGRQDPILPIQTGKWLSDLIAPNCRSHQWHAFNGPHTIPPEAIVGTCKLMKKLVKIQPDSE
jgi:phospholipase/carboxylesterase